MCIDQVNSGYCIWLKCNRLFSISQLGWISYMYNFAIIRESLCNYNEAHPEKNQHCIYKHTKPLYYRGTGQYLLKIVFK